MQLAERDFAHIAHGKLVIICSYISPAPAPLSFKLTVHRSTVIKKAGLPRRGGTLHSGPLNLAFAPGRASRVQNFCLSPG